MVTRWELDSKILGICSQPRQGIQRQGFEKVYLVVVGLRESDLKKLTEYLSESPARSVDMITAAALIPNRRREHQRAKHIHA